MVSKPQRMSETVDLSLNDMVGLEKGMMNGEFYQRGMGEECEFAHMG